jgi:hypothetical protein
METDPSGKKLSWSSFEMKGFLQNYSIVKSHFKNILRMSVLVTWTTWRYNIQQNNIQQNDTN